MVNINGKLLPTESHEYLQNRALLLGDGIFETVKVLDGRVLFLEDHYFRLMSGMRVLRMEIPMHFTMEYFEQQLLETARANDCSASARVRLTVYRKPGGLYLPQTREVDFHVQASMLEQALYAADASAYEVELYKDFYVSAQLLSSLKSTNRLLNITASIFADENGYQNCLLLNDAKNVIEAINGNLFMLTGNKLVTPPVADGCINGVLRRQVLTLAKKIEGIEVVEQSISPFDLQKADELFVTNVITGIRAITRYRKKDYVSDFSAQLRTRLNAQLRLG